MALGDSQASRHVLEWDLGSARELYSFLQTFPWVLHLLCSCGRDHSGAPLRFLATENGIQKQGIDFVD